MESQICKPCRMIPKMYKNQRIETKRRLSNKKTWDEEMIELFCDYNPEELLAVLPNNSLDPRLQPIFMGLNDKRRALSCMESGDGEPLLNLVERNILDLYSSHEESKSFTFYSRSNSQEQTCCFESAAFPGWFMSTSTEINKPVRLSREGGPDITNFYCERKDPLE